MIFLFHQLCKNQQFTHNGFFFDEKETLEESNEPSLIKLPAALSCSFFIFMSICLRIIKNLIQ